MTQLKVRELMATDIVTLDEDEDLDLAEQLMQLARIRHLPVVRDGDLVGLVTNRDLLRAQASQLAEPSAEQKKAMNLWVKAGWIMTRDVHTVEPDTPLLEAAHMIRKHKYGCLPVVDGSKLVGILTEDDFVRWAIGVLGDPRQ